MQKKAGHSLAQDCFFDATDTLVWEIPQMLMIEVDRS